MSDIEANYPKSLYSVCHQVWNLLKWLVMFSSENICIHNFRYAHEAFLPRNALPEVQVLIYYKSFFLQFGVQSNLPMQSPLLSSHLY